MQFGFRQEVGTRDQNFEYETSLKISRTTNWFHRQPKGILRPAIGCIVEDHDWNGLFSIPDQIPQEPSLWTTSRRKSYGRNIRMVQWSKRRLSRVNVAILTSRHLRWEHPEKRDPVRWQCISGFLESKQGCRDMPMILSFSLGLGGHGKEALRYPKSQPRCYENRIIKTCKWSKDPNIRIRNEGTAVVKVFNYLAKTLLKNRGLILTSQFYESFLTQAPSVLCIRL